MNVQQKKRFTGLLSLLVGSLSISSLVIGGVAIAGCDKSKDQPAPSAATAASASATGNASARALAPSAALPSANASATSAGAVGEGSFSGTYKASAGGFYLPTDAPNGADWKGVTWQGDSADGGLGEGKLTLTVTKTGTVQGELDGALGPAILSGFMKDGQLTAQILRKDPKDQGFTGTLIGKVEGSKVEGTMNVSASRAHLIRKATFSIEQR